MDNLSDTFNTVLNGEYNFAGVCQCGGNFYETLRMYIMPPLLQYFTKNGEPPQQISRFLTTKDIWCEDNGSEYKCDKCGHKIIILTDYSVLKDGKKYQRDRRIFDKAVIEHTYVYS